MSIAVFDSNLFILGQLGLEADDPRALHWAAVNGDVDLLRHVLKQGVSVHYNKDDALIWASRNGHVKCVVVLLNRGADVNAGRNAALKAAIVNGHADCAQVLTQCGAKRLDALDLAERAGHHDLIKMFKQ